MSSHAKMYVCDTWDDLCDIGEHTIDHRCYRSRKDAELRASRLTYDDEEVRSYAKVVELDACWEPDENAKLHRENAKLRELVRILAYCMQVHADCDGCKLNGSKGELACDPLLACDGLHEMLRELGIEVPEQ